ncbi:sensor histidine kinase [Romboutsia lituseburensis]|uniref:sensor histidine kinase n=1 Tax=Romboutsia lituseburensis TaxID=1537 RepID=UPI00215AFE55|nr:HAMP domain-containing histidine kinase [Romboutsia lituseburensis]MCR8744033.1 HAMP domain-containing histidine kinase [Romboutsia lituseburensis]
MSSVFIIENYEINLVTKVSVIFIITIIFIGVTFIYFIRSKINKIIRDLDYIADNAINNQNFVTGYKEDKLSSLENKMFKYVSITKSNKETIEEERNKVKSLVSDISHQTKTPISNILLYSQLILENNKLDNYSKEILEDINGQAERLNFLIQALIKMSRLESNIIQTAIKNNSIQELILKSVQKVYKNAEDKEISIIYNCNKELIACFDIKWTTEALVNIIENSIKYTNRGGSISIDIISYEMFKRIDIKDNGIGIDENEINNIFKRFYRCKNAKTYDGVGIGLYLSREIISMQGGYIKVSSQIDKGTTMSIYLPS